MYSTFPCDFVLPAEWEPQSAIMLTWPHADTDWKQYLRQITNTYLELSEIITRFEHLLVVTPIVESTHKMLSERLSSEQMKRVLLFEIDSNDTWARDHGPITLISRNKQNSFIVPIHLLDFTFNGWGEKFAWQKDNAITSALHGKGLFSAALESHDDFVLEGGSIESDGKGTVFTTAQCLLAPRRNQPLSEAEIGERLKGDLGADRVVWLRHGNLVGDDTDGHIDTIVRICPDDTLLYVGCDDEADEQYADFKALETELQALTTVEGKPYRLLKLPMPDEMVFDGERLPATYANFLVINGAVIVPVYGQREKDEQAKALVAEAFPGREIVAVDASVIVRQHGSIHCLTMQLPKGLIKNNL